MWEAFQSLHRSRGAGMGGPEPIKLSEIGDAYDRLCPFEDYREFVRLIQELDSEFMEWASLKQGGKDGRTKGRN